MTGRTRVLVEALGALTEIGRGGQGRVYETAHHIAAWPWPLVYKEYLPVTRAQLDLGALEEMVGYGSRLLAGGENLGDRAAWPVAVVERQGVVLGFLMRRVPAEFTLKPPSSGATGSVLLGQVQHLLNNDAFLTKRGIPVHDRWRLEFLRDTADTIERLHRQRIVVGDLSPMNLLASFVSRPRCFFIDCDAMRLAGRSVLDQAETRSWEVPLHEQLATDATDAFKFALLAIRLFARDQDVRDSDAISRVSARLGHLARRGTAPQAGMRPAFTDWIQALDAATPTASTAFPWELATVPTPFSTAVWGGTGSWPTVPAARTAPHQPPTRPVTARTTPAPALRQPRRWRRGLASFFVLCAAVLVVWLGGPAVAGLTGRALGWGQSQGDPSTEVSNPAEQAARVQSLLARSKVDRTRVLGAVGKVSGCRDVAGGLDAFERATAGRRGELAAAESLQVDALPDGPALKSTLVEAFQHSLAADEAFVRWARGVQQDGCSSASLHGADLRTADSQSVLATAAKKTFVAMWTPIARAYGHPVPTHLDI